MPRALPIHFVFALLFPVIGNLSYACTRKTWVFLTCCACVFHEFPCHLATPRIQTRRVFEFVLANTARVPQCGATLYIYLSYRLRLYLNCKSSLFSLLQKCIGHFSLGFCCVRWCTGTNWHITTTQKRQKRFCEMSIRSVPTSPDFIRLGRVYRAETCPSSSSQRMTTNNNSKILVSGNRPIVYC